MRDHPRRRVLRRLGRGFAALVGTLLVLAGLVASAIPLLFVALEIASLVTGDSSAPEMDPDTVRLLAGSAAAAVVGLVLGIRLVRGKRRLVLFLRRFGFVPATQVVSFAVARAVGRASRVVTLDDLRVAPVGVRRRTRRLAALGGLVGLAGIAAGVFWIFGGAFDRFLSDTLDQLVPKGQDLADTIGGLIGAVLVGIVVGGLVLGLVVLLMSVAGVTMLFSLSSYAAVRKAERSKAREIRTADKIARTIRSVARRSRRVLGPRLVVVRVASEIWKPVVQGLAASSAAVVVDVSEPSKNLLWEIQRLRPEFSSRWVLVGHGDRLGYLDASPEADEFSPPSVRLAAALDGQEVLAYESESRRAMKRFAAGLRAKLEAIG